MENTNNVVHVRKQYQATWGVGNPRYRYSQGRVDLSLADMEAKKNLKLKYGVSMTKTDIKAVEEKWAHKLK